MLVDAWCVCVGGEGGGNVVVGGCVCVGVGVLVCVELGVVYFCTFSKVSVSLTFVAYRLNKIY